jgi:hypothetical protein
MRTIGRKLLVAFMLAGVCIKMLPTHVPYRKRATNSHHLIHDWSATEKLFRWFWNFPDCELADSGDFNQLI